MITNNFSTSLSMNSSQGLPNSLNSEMSADSNEENMEIQKLSEDTWSCSLGAFSFGGGQEKSDVTINMNLESNV